MTDRQLPRGEAPTASWASTPAVRRTMQANQRRDTKPELLVRSLLHRAGHRYRVDWPLPFDVRRRADIAFPRRRVIVFIDGCFWHGCPLHYQAPRANADFWRSKLEGNIARDRETDARLAEAGWSVLRFWEHEPAEDVAGRIVQVLDQRG